MRVGILGSGAVGQALANGFIKHGHEVMVGTRSPDKLEDWRAQAGERGQVGSFAQTAVFGDLLVLAARGTAAKHVLETAGAENLAGMTILDTTNPISEAPPDNGVLKFFTSLDESLMEQLQTAFPEANFVKAFSCVGNALMVNPDFGGLKPTMFICGNDENAKKEASGILDLFGYEVADMGGAEAARAIEPLCILWCIPGFLRDEWMHAFKLLKQ